ncbi:MAG: hypothetical protein KUG71_07270 [Porticoccaceae bacterium]|nr:hypothetical protein [Porticoccaceae bacterium]
MGTAIIELNDSAIQCLHGETLLVMPGYALLTDQGVVTGDEALQKAWLLPQQSHNQYWHQLSLSPLTGANRYARHHADLAYAQLQSLYHEAGKPENIIFAVPGNFTNDQLSILLGLVKASPFKATGLVDSAVAAACQADTTGDVIHVDIQLHSSVITRLECGAQITRLHSGQYPDVSLQGFYDTWAHFIADKFISQYRYDPMHTAQGEQQLRNLLPLWLEQLTSEEEIEIDISAQQGNFRLNILRVELLAANSQRWQRLADALASITAKDGQADTLLISHRLMALPGVDNYIEYSDYSEPDAVLSACQTQAKHIVSDSDKLSFVTELPLLGATLPGGDKSAELAIPRQTPGQNLKPQSSKPQNLKSRSLESQNTVPGRSRSPEALSQQPGKTETVPPIRPAKHQAPSHLLHQHQAHALKQGLSITMGLRGLEIKACESTDKPEQQAGQLLINYQAQKVVLHTDQNKLPIQCSGNLDKLQVGDEIIIRGETLKFIEVL